MTFIQENKENYKQFGGIEVGMPPYLFIARSHINLVDVGTRLKS